MLKHKTVQESPNSGRKHILLMSSLMFVAILVVVGVGYMILNPAKRESDYRNAQRTTAILQIASLVANYVKNVGDIPSNIPLDRTCANYGQEICRIGASNCENYVDLSKIASSGGITTLPIDPSISSSDESGTGYYISKDGNGNILVCAPNAERNMNINIKRFVY